jgi:hypothetical protein
MPEKQLEKVPENQPEHPVVPPSPPPAESPRDPLWDPAQAAIGVVAIIIAVAVLDLLPRFIRARFGKATDPDIHFARATTLEELP